LIISFLKILQFMIKIRSDLSSAPFHFVMCSLKMFSHFIFGSTFLSVLVQLLFSFFF
jgi:hypothetical protein